jgi:hypothetical protein
VLTWFVVPALLFTLSEDKAIRFVLPLMPPVAFWLAGLVTAWVPRRWAPALLVVPLALAVYNVVPAEATTTQLYVGGWAVVPERDMLSFYPNAPVCAECDNARFIDRIEADGHALAAIAGGRQYGGL